MKLWIRQMLEVAMLVPAVYMCYMPVMEELRLDRKHLLAELGIACLVIVPGASAFCAWQDISTNMLLLPLLPLLFFYYCRSVRLSVWQCLLLFCNACMLLAFCTAMVNYLMAPREAQIACEPFSLQSALLCLGLACATAALYRLALRKHIGWLLENLQKEGFWRVLWLLPMLSAIMMLLYVPENPKVILAGRIRQVAIISLIFLLTLVCLLIFAIYTAVREIKEKSDLKNERELRELETRRYYEWRERIEQTQQLRHDFKHHLHVMTGLMQAKKYDELASYLNEYEAGLNRKRPILCANPAVDSLAGQYDALAESKGVQVNWQLKLPEQLPLPETDMCLLMGNLLENAIEAAAQVQDGRVQVLCSMPSKRMLGISVQNPYAGQLQPQDGFFRSARHDGPAVGLHSVSSTVKRYHGQMDVETENGVFRVRLLLNL